MIDYALHPNRSALVILEPRASVSHQVLLSWDAARRWLVSFRWTGVDGNGAFVDDDVDD